MAMSEHNVSENYSVERQDNEISEVVVFADQAQIKHHAKASAEPGLNRFLIDIQSFLVDPDSAQASVFGEGEILAVQYREFPVKESPQEELKSLEERRRYLQRKHKSLDNRQESTEKQRRFLDSMIGFSEHEMPKRLQTQFPEMESLREMMEFLRNGYQRVAESAEAVDHEIEDLTQELALLERRVKSLQQPKASVRRSVEVLFDSAREQIVDIEASYVARGANWKPFYRIDAPIKLGAVNMTMFARIQQKTGEDWSKIRLTLSNALPTHGSALPNLHSWYLRQPAVHGRAHAVLAASVAKAMEAESVESTVVDGEHATYGEVESSAPAATLKSAQQKELPSSFDYTFPQRVDVGSGSEETLLPLQSKQLPAEFFNYAVPQVDPLVYLVCQAEADRALLAGRLNVHFGGRFVASTKLTEKRPGEHMLFNLGGDRGVKVLREKVTDKHSETFFGMVDRQSVARELEFRIVVENLKHESTRVQVIDAVPVSTTDRFQVKGLELVPEPTQKDWNDREGVMFWDLELSPRSVKEIHIRCYVKHPKDISPQGL